MRGSGFALRLSVMVCVGSFLAVYGCRPGGDGDGDSDADVDVTCTPGHITCEDGAAHWCNDSGDGWSNVVVCGGATPLCSISMGCVLCSPGSPQCTGNILERCNGEGTAWSVEQECPEGTTCYGGTCGNPCEQALNTNSYEGCEYRAVTLMNSEVSPDFLPAIVVSNQNQQSATVTVTRGAAAVAEVTVAPNSSQAIDLPWVMDLKQQITEEHPDEESTNVPDGSYRVVSTMPVTVYQFNPFEYGLDHDCLVDDISPGDGLCYSYSNDASLLLPVHVLTEHYIVMARPTRAIYVHVYDPFWEEELEAYSFSPSTMAVVNPQDHEITASIRFSSPTQAGPGLVTYAAGETGEFTIAAGGVLQLAAQVPEDCTPGSMEPSAVPCPFDPSLECTYGYCSLTDHDLTGTEISASDPVAVFGGHNCDFVPYDRWACDHLEEQLFPFETWGRHFVVNQSHRENGEPDLYRVLSGAEGNQVRFTPASVHAETTLSRGGLIEFEAQGAFEIESDAPILVGQFLVGQNYNDFTAGDLPPGDPAFALAVPVEQYRSAYNFIAPDSFDRSYVNITTSEGGVGSIELDGNPLSGEAWEVVGTSGYHSLRLEIAPGSHTIRSAASVTFGILVYGYGQYTSYMFPGGLDLDQIAVW